MKHYILAAVAALAFSSAHARNVLEPINDQVDEECVGISSSVAKLIELRKKGTSETDLQRILNGSGYDKNIRSFVYHHVFDLAVYNDEASRLKAWSECVIIGNIYVKTQQAKQ